MCPQYSCERHTHLGGHCLCPIESQGPGELAELLFGIEPFSQNAPLDLVEGHDLLRIVAIQLMRIGRASQRDTVIDVGSPVPAAHRRGKTSVAAHSPALTVADPRLLAEIREPDCRLP